ncbi:MAG: type 4a pilus biogenesis protein PilO, partial [Candidatus Omnitrophota bacterium]
IKEFEEIFPREREIPKLLEKLSEVASASSVRIIGIKPVVVAGFGLEDEDSIYQTIPIEIIATSGYHELGEFLQKLETGYRFIMIKELDIDASKGNVRKHDIRLITETFVLVQK